MRRKLGIVIVVSIITVVFVGITASDEKDTSNMIFHKTLANPELYVDGEFSDDFMLESGEYRLRFTPNGDSPKILSIRIQGESFAFKEDFKLNGTKHNTGISEYYTWEYLGNNYIKTTNSQIVQISINPNGNFLGPVSVSLIRE